MTKELIPQEIIEQRIFLIRGQKVMLNSDLARLYGVPTKRLNEQVRRNIKRFPEDFMFQLTWDEAKSLRSQFATLNKRRGQHPKYSPHAFTEHGILMLSSVLNSERAIQVNIAIMRVFVNIRRIVSSNKEIVGRLDRLEDKVEKQDKSIKTIFEVIRKPQTALIAPDRPFTNKKIAWDVIRSCKGYIYWVDKYFTKVGLELLSEGLENKRVKRIKILISIDKVEIKFREIFEDFMQEMKNNSIQCELRVIIDNKIKSSIHDRWIISKNSIFNVPSTDTLARGQYSEVKITQNKPPFKEWWNKSKDIIRDWGEIEKRRKNQK